MEHFEFKLTNGKPIFANCDFYTCIFDYLASFDAAELPLAEDLVVDVVLAERITVKFSIEDYLQSQVEDLNTLESIQGVEAVETAINAKINGVLKNCYEATDRYPTLKSVKAILKAFKQTKKGNK